MGNIPVVTAPCLRDVLVRAGQIPLAAARAGVVPRGRRGEQTVHGEDAPAHVVDADVAADADLLKLPLVGTEALCSAAHAVVLRVVIVENVVRIGAEFRREVLDRKSTRLNSS